MGGLERGVGCGVGRALDMGSRFVRVEVGGKYAVFKGG